MIIKGKILKNILGFVSKSKSRPALCGVFFEVKKGGINIYATDAYAACIYEDGQPSEKEGNFLVDFEGFKPLNGLYEINLLPDGALVKNKKTGQEQKLSYIDAKFPNVRQVLPSGKKKAEKYVCFAAKHYEMLNACIPDADSIIPYQDEQNGPCLWKSTLFYVLILPTQPRN